MKKYKARLVAGTIAVVMAFASATGVQAASISYVPEPSRADGYLVDWNSKAHRAHVVEYNGMGDGTFTDDGAQRVVTFDSPLSYPNEGFDCLGLPMQQRVDVLQMAFRPMSGTAARGTTQVVEIGNITDIDGCTPGAVTTFGAPGDPGLTTTHLDMTRRAPITDLVPGARLAGPSETAPGGVAGNPRLVVQQLATIGAGSLGFEDSGHVYPISITDGWIVVDYGTFRRAYTRLTRDARGGVETWLWADWNGAPENVEQTMMVQPRDGAGFGDRNAAAHHWDSGMFLASVTQTSYDLYRDHSGLRHLVFTDGSGEAVMPVTWRFEGANVAIKRPWGDSGHYHRVWVPVANYGKNHFVMEGEELVDASGASIATTIAPRVNFYVDGGKAFPEPAAASRASTWHAEVDAAGGHGR